MAAFLECLRAGNFSNLETLVGIPYEEWSTDPAHGLDCWSLPNAIFSAVGAPLPPRPTCCMPIPWCEERLAEFGWLKIGKPERADLLVFRHPFRAANHLGVFLGVRRFLHTTPRTGACISVLGQGWLRSLAGTFRHERVRNAAKAKITV